MFKVDYDLSCLTVEELLEARTRLHRNVEHVEARHVQLAHLFEALEDALHSRYGLLTGDAKHEIAQALAIDETTGEWDAGA
jgi:hypothetical protein